MKFGVGDSVTVVVKCLYLWTESVSRMKAPCEGVVKVTGQARAQGLPLIELVLNIKPIVLVYPVVSHCGHIVPGRPI